MTPAPAQPIVAPLAAPITAPQKAPLMTRAPNCCGAFRLGVDGKLVGDELDQREYGENPRREPVAHEGRPASRDTGSQPRAAPQLTAAGAVMARSPATIPIEQGGKIDRHCSVPRFLRQYSTAPARNRARDTAMQYSSHR